MKVYAHAVSAAKLKSYTLVYPVFEVKDNSIKVDNREYDVTLGQACGSGDFSGKAGQVLFHYADGHKNNAKVNRTLFIGIGKEEKADSEAFRKTGGQIVKALAKTKAKKIALIMPSSEKISQDGMLESLAEGLLLGSYTFKKYKSLPTDEEERQNDENRVKEAVFVIKKSKAIDRKLHGAVVLSEAVKSARDMANEPANKWTPEDFAAQAQKLAKKYEMKSTVLHENNLRRLGMGGILGVGQGSSNSPKMIVLEYWTKKTNPTLLLVGKGLTFDSGGISLKPSAGMHEMKYDMCGGAAVLATMQAVGEEKPAAINVVAIVPATENMPGPGAVKPGDVITHYGGKTVEVINTDAEGRLILADALSYGIKKFKPAAVIDLATLTGAVIIALGHHRTGLMSNNDELADNLIAAGESCGEPLWRLPLDKDYSRQLKSDVADLKNVDKRDAGAITAAAFLQEFIKEGTAWAHLDIAGTAWNFTEKSYIPKGPSGIGVRLLMEFIRKWK